MPIYQALRRNGSTPAQWKNGVAPAVRRRRARVYGNQGVPHHRAVPRRSLILGRARHRPRRDARQPGPWHPEGDVTKPGGTCQAMLAAAGRPAAQAPARVRAQDNRDAPGRRPYFVLLAVTVVCLVVPVLIM